MTVVRWVVSSPCRRPENDQEGRRLNRTREKTREQRQKIKKNQTPRDQQEQDNQEGVRRFADGDLVVIIRNDHRRGLLNGTRATVEHAGRTALRLHTEAGQRVDLPASWAVDHLDHGYALTVHKAQGLTVEAALVYGTAALNRQAGYVALSRGRAGTYLFTSHESLARAVASPDVVYDGEPGDALDALQQRRDWSRRHALAVHQQPAEQLEDRGLSR